MKQNKKKETGFVRFSKRLLIASFVAFVIGIVVLNSYESTLNIDCQKLEKEITTIRADIDGLDMKEQELASFSRLESIATKKGYSNNQGRVTVAVTGVQRD